MPIAQTTVKYKANGNIKSTDTLYLHTDHLNTPRQATADNQAVVWNWESDAFGQGKQDKDPDGDGTKQVVKLRFPGQYHDGESGLFYNWNRYYDPVKGRYVTSDPIGLEGGVNTYAYVGGNPIARVDPRGLNAMAIVVAGGGVAKAGGSMGLMNMATGVMAMAMVHMAANTAGGEGAGECSEDDEPCPPCNPPAGTIRYRIDMVPPSQPHYPHKGSHVHLYKMNQNPNNCQCFWQPVGTTELPPPSGAEPM